LCKSSKRTDIGPGSIPSSSSKRDRRKYRWWGVRVSLAVRGLGAEVKERYDLETAASEVEMTVGVVGVEVVGCPLAFLGP
jgi:hypothetical protein